jgi:hypothetical protein
VKIVLRTHQTSIYLLCQQHPYLFQNLAADACKICYFKNITVEYRQIIDRKELAIPLAILIFKTIGDTRSDTAKVSPILGDSDILLRY